MRRSKWLPLLFICVAGAAGLSAALVWRQTRREASPDLVTGVYLAPRRALPEFSLIDVNGRTFTRADLLGHWSMLFFGYTNCPDLCPTTLTTLAAMDKRMRAARDPLRPQVVFVSVDARRDTPAQLARYIPYFDPRFIGLTASAQKTIEALARQLGVAVVMHAEANGVYSVDHSGAIFVADPHADLAAVLTGPFTAANLQSDFRRIAAQGS